MPPSADALVALSTLAWARACTHGDQAQAALEHLHAHLLDLNAPPAALRALQRLEDEISGEGFAVAEALSALRQAVEQRDHRYKATLAQAGLACDVAAPPPGPRLQRCRPPALP